MGHRPGWKFSILDRITSRSYPLYKGENMAEKIVFCCDLHINKDLIRLTECLNFLDYLKKYCLANQINQNTCQSFTRSFTNALSQQTSNHHQNNNNRRNAVIIDAIFIC